MAQLLRRHWWLRARRVELLSPILPVLERTDAQEDPELLGEALVSLTLAANYVDLQTARGLAEQALVFAAFPSSSAVHSHEYVPHISLPVWLLHSLLRPFSEAEQAPRHACFPRAKGSWCDPRRNARRSGKGGLPGYDDPQALPGRHSSL